MWQAETFDPATIDRELSWGQEIGYNVCRVFLQELVFAADPDGFLSLFDQFLSIAHRRGYHTMPILFDDCAFAGKAPYLGPQAAPIPSVHNSQWTPSPAVERVNNPAEWPALETYASSTVAAFRGDERILTWDVYNEPGNSAQRAKSLPLLRAASEWVRAANPTQPVTIAVWDDDLRELNAASLELSDVISFHRYGDAADLTQIIQALKTYNRPILCTEWMARTLNSRFETHLPIFQVERVAAIQWGLVAGRTQTYFPWGTPENAPGPELWFHDILRADGTPYNAQEIGFLKQQLRPN